MLCKLKHTSVVQMFGVCHSTGTEMTMLVYEKVKEGALDTYLKREAYVCLCVSVSMCPQDSICSMLAAC